MAKKNKKQCSIGEHELDEHSVCSKCYEQMRQVLLEAVADRDQKITRLNTQMSLYQETVKNVAEGHAEVKNTQKEKSKKTA